MTTTDNMTKLLRLFEELRVVKSKLSRHDELLSERFILTRKIDELIAEETKP